MEFAGVGKPMLLAYRSVKAPSGNRLLIQVTACGVCRTDLHLLEGDLHRPKRRVVPGHEVIGRVTAMGPDVRGFQLGDRVGIRGSDLLAVVASFACLAAKTSATTPSSRGTRLMAASPSS